MNFWDDLMGDDAHAAEYMLTYGEGPGAETRHTLGSFVNNEETVLDVGCGPGWNFEHFIEHGPHLRNYKGIDYSERFVRVANERIKRTDHPTLLPEFDKLVREGHMTIFELGDARNIQEPDESWDVVILQDCLEHTNGYEKPITEALRIARKRVIITFWHMVENQEGEHLNDDPEDNAKDGWGYWYARPRWETFLDTLPYAWFHHQITDNKPRDYYIIDKDEPQ